jgi:hypothetical protein
VVPAQTALPVLNDFTDVDVYPLPVWSVTIRPGAGHKVLGRTGEAELAADLQQVVVVPSFPGLGRGDDRLLGRCRVSQARSGSAVAEVQKGRIRPVGEITQPTQRQIPALTGASPIGDACQFYPHVRHQRPVINDRGIGPTGAEELLRRL